MIIKYLLHAESDIIYFTSSTLSRHVSPSTCCVTESPTQVAAPSVIPQVILWVATGVIVTVLLIATVLGLCFVRKHCKSRVMQTVTESEYELQGEDSPDHPIP